jgi:hypothetical protein
MIGRRGMHVDYWWKSQIEKRPLGNEEELGG